MSDKGNRTASRLPGALKILAAIAGLVVLVWLGRQLGSYVPEFAAWVESLGVWGPLVFIAGYAIATVAFIPGSLLTLAAGAIFGLARGTLFVFFGASLGAGGAFLVARYLARSWVERKLESKPRFQTIDQAVAQQGRKIVFLLRLSPVFPFNLLNYALGLTRVRFSDYLIACFGMIPGTFLYVYYGKALGSLAAVAGGAQVERDAGYWVVLTLGLVATVIVTTVVTRIAKRALSQEVSDD
ncbi:MAG: TVP38/TMEM64 family protein [bacterium]|nr:TVP38/TMEM64 family protein [bacterium]